MHSSLTSTLEQPLSSGVSVPEIVDQVLPSIVEIRAGNGGGTGFVLTPDGLVITNKHVLQGNPTARLRFTSGQEYVATVTNIHPILDLAYLTIDSTGTFQPIHIGDANQVRAGEQVVIIGFPIGPTLGAEPTVNTGIISAKRDGMLQTDAPLNPGNSGGPMLDAYGNVIGVIKSRIDENQGVIIAGIGFAIPINNVDIAIPAQVAPTLLPPALIPTARPTNMPSLPTLAPTIDVAATKAAIDAQLAFAQTKVAHDREIERQRQEADAYAVSAAATAVAQIPTPTPRPTSTPVPPPTATPIPPTVTPMPTATPHPAAFCQQWEAMILEWVKLGNNYPPRRGDKVTAKVPRHPILSHQIARQYCIQDFPMARLYQTGSGGYAPTVGFGARQLLPGTYRYVARNGDNRVDGGGQGLLPCRVTLNAGEDDWSSEKMEYGESFEFQFHTYHGRVGMVECYGFMYRVGD